MKSINQKRTFISRYLPAFLFFSGMFLFALSCGDPKSGGEEAAGDQAQAQPVTNFTSETVAIAEGGEWFNSYCVLCHGEKADGKGNMADVLKTAPLDLTKIAQRRNGVFPDEEIGKIIAGVEEVPGHSTGEMPAWWETFKKSEGITDEKVLQEKIDHIVAYLRSIQQ